MENGRQRLGISLEYHPEHGTPEEVIEIVYPRLIRALGRVQPEFHDDWTTIYQTWDDDPAKRILKLDLVPWPLLEFNQFPPTSALSSVAPDES